MHDYQKKQHNSLQYDFVNFSVRSSEFFFEKRHRSKLFVYLPDGVYLKVAPGGGGTWFLSDGYVRLKVRG